VEIDEQIGDVHVKTIPTFHDESEGADRGTNSMFLFETADLRILHAGDLGHTLTEDQLAAIGDIDILLIPVGGHFTVGPEGATQVVEQLNPSFVIPMHYRTDVVSFSGSENLEGLEPFLLRKSIRRAEGNTLALSRDRLFEKTNVIVMDYREATTRRKARQGVARRGGRPLALRPESRRMGNGRTEGGHTGAGHQAGGSH
jgi:hypothetical protein